MTFETTDQASQQRLLARVAAYYSDKIREHGPTPRGVDWRDTASQEARFDGLRRIFGHEQTGSVIELGCGYGALYGYLKRKKLSFSYHGYDISEEMVAAARATYVGEEMARFDVGSGPAEGADYCVASGIFNVRFDFSDDEWRRHLFSTIDQMASAGHKGFAFNCLTSFSDRHRQEARLFYAVPGEILDYCLERYGRHVSLLHGTPAYEFTVLVWHDSPAG